MEYIPLPILEGLIHNVRTPLNLILGFAQHCRTRDRNVYSDKIRNAGIRVDDLLQELWDSLNAITEAKTRQSLLSWIKAEQVLMHNCLKLKHRFLVETPGEDGDITCTFSGQSLSEFIDVLLTKLADTMPHDSLRIRFEPSDKPALMLHFTCKDGCAFDAEEINRLCNDYPHPPYTHYQLATAPHKLELELFLEP